MTDEIQESSVPIAKGQPEMSEEGATQAPSPANGQQPQQVKRFTIYHRIEHWVFMASFSILGLTGLVQRYSENAFSTWFVTTLGGLDNVRRVHHAAAFVMMLVTIYHIGAVIYRMYVLRVRPTMLPSMADIRAALDSVKYYVGFRKNPAQQGRYTFEEKAEYWAVVWGTIVMGITGFVMWNPIITTRVLSGEFVPAAKVAHGLEAVLAVVAIFLWHFYHVLVKTLNKSMFTGKLSGHQMVDEHPLELADIKAGLATRPLDPEKKRQRERRFWPAYSVLAAFSLVGVYFFVSYEVTALETVSPISTEVVFAPLTPTPLPTPHPTNTPAPLPAVATWDDGIGVIFEGKCGNCHNSTAKLGGLDLSSYQNALTGSNSGPVILPGDPVSSLIYSVQAAGGHPGQLSQEDLGLVRTWIEAGAPEK